MENERLELLKRSLVSEFERSLDERIDRYFSVGHHWITGDHHFADASAECLKLYRDGFFLSCVMVTQAVSDGIAKFVAERNRVTRLHKESNRELVQRMLQLGVVTTRFAAAFDRIQGSFRNDYHHMNPPVGQLDHASIAKQNIADLAEIERDIFECNVGSSGRLIPRNLLYWDADSDRMIAAYVRLR
jgi:hypothetical protein